MKLIYVRWKDVRSFLRSIDEPVSSAFQIIIHKKWQSFRCNKPSKLNLAGGRWVYEVEIPEEMIT